ncbi:aldehyde dehydrogenase family protein [Amycolatopsis kentuckyensis]|uniref:aldehyde dehydrogenase family protein n=1 Tax=Amycolatopsis kentuckyensis TaxID=218823 RepID=UPI003564C9D1
MTVVDGRDVPEQGNGYFLGGTLFDRVSAHMRIYREEIFGPVLALVRVESLTEALDLVNGHEFGNGAVVFTSDGRAAQEFVSRVSAGMVGVNVPVPVARGRHGRRGFLDAGRPLSSPAYQR